MPPLCTARGRGVSAVKRGGEGSEKVWDGPSQTVQGEHPVIHSLVLLGDLKARGKQTPVPPQVP